jgi:hypothetical protein
VAIVSLPRLSDPLSRRDALVRGLALLGAVSAAVVLGATVLGSLAAWLVGASDTAVTTWAGLFAAIGCGYAVVQFLVYARIGRAASSGLWLLLGSALTLTVLALSLRPDLVPLALLALAVSLAAAGALLAVEARVRQPAGPPSAASGAGQSPGEKSGS